VKNYLFKLEQMQRSKRANIHSNIKILAY